MGNGASTTDINQHLRRWEVALNDLNHVCKTNRRTFSSGVSSADGDAPPDRSHRTHSSRENHAGDPAAAQGGDNRSLSGSRLTRGSGRQQRQESGGNLSSKSSNVRVTVEDNESSAETPRSGARTPKPKRADKIENRLRNTRFASQYPWEPELLEDGMPCNPLAVLAAGLTGLLQFKTDDASTSADGGTGVVDAATERKHRVTVEDIFFSAQLPLHMLHRRHLTLQEMYDVVREFLDVDNRFKGAYTVEVVHFDAMPKEGQLQVGDNNDIGERQVRLPLHQFRKELHDAVTRHEVGLRIVNFDPYYLQEALRVVVEQDLDASEGGNEELPTVVASGQPLEGENDTFKTSMFVSPGAVPLMMPLNAPPSRGASSSNVGGAGLHSSSSDMPSSLGRGGGPLAITVDAADGGGQFAPPPSLGGEAAVIHSSNKLVSPGESIFHSLSGPLLPNNGGLFAAVVDIYEAVDTCIKIAEAALTHDTRIMARTIELPLNALYDAMCCPAYDVSVSATLGSQVAAPHRARGFLRVLKKDDDSTMEMSGNVRSVERADVEPMFSADLMRGDVLGSLHEGIHAHAVSPWVSAHLSALGWALHLILGPRATGNSHGHGRGLPLSDMIRTLQLPLDVVLQADVSLDEAASMFAAYLKCKGYDSTLDVRCGHVRRLNARKGASVSVSQSDLEGKFIEHVTQNEDPENPNHVMIIQFDANVAHNAVGLASTPHWGVVAGFNIDTQMTRVIDAHPKRFCTSWTAPLERIHASMTGLGYIVVSAKSMRHLRHADEFGGASNQHPGGPHSATQPSLSLGASPIHNNTRRPSYGGLEPISVYQVGSLMEGSLMPQPFPLPPVPLGLTIAAAALARLNVPDVTPDRMVHGLANELNSMLLVGLSGLSYFMNEYLLTRRLHVSCCADATAIGLASLVGGFLDARHFHVEGLTNTTPRSRGRAIRGAAPPAVAESIPVPFTHFVTELRAMFDTNATLSAAGDAPASSPAAAMMVNISPDSVLPFHCGRPSFGEFALVLSMDPVTPGTSDHANRLVRLADASSSSLQRSWSMPVSALFDAMALRRAGQLRTRGYIIVRRYPAASITRHTPSRNRNFSLAACPVQSPFASTPSPHLTALSLAFAQLDYFASPEELFYEAYLKTVTQQRRRGSRAFAWRDMELMSLGILNERFTVALMAQLGTQFLKSRVVHSFVVSVAPEESTASIDSIRFLVQEMTSTGTTAVLVMNYDVAKAHGLSGFGYSCALVEAYDHETGVVTLLESQCSLFGSRWTTHVDCLGQITYCETDGNASPSSKKELGFVIVRQIPESDQHSSSAGSVSPGAVPSGGFSAFQAPF